MIRELWHKTLIKEAATLRQAISNLNESALQIAIVVDSDGILIGTLTDGDIRRGLMRGLDIDMSIDSVIHREPLVVPFAMERESVLQLMQINKIFQLPIIDKERRVIGLHLFDELIAPRTYSNTMVIMAGGRGVRLQPHTDNCPKPLLPVVGKPILEHIIEGAKKKGFSHFVLSIHYLGHMIEDYFGDGSRWGVKIEYLRESSPSGTAGAISLLDPRPKKPFIVTNGDVLTDIHYGELLEFHSRHNAAATMAVSLHEWQHPFGVLKTKGIDILGIEEKPISRTHINAGVYVLEPYVLDELEKGEYCDMPTLFDNLRNKKQRTIAYPMHEPWLDVGRPDDYESANTQSDVCQSALIPESNDK